MEPQLRKAGYAGRFYETPNSPCKQFRDDLADGVAIFWRTSKFRLIELCEAGYHAAGRSDSSSVALIAVSCDCALLSPLLLCASDLASLPSSVCG